MALYAFDGTWVDADQQEITLHTNVKKFSDLYHDSVIKCYASGPGTRGGFIGKYLGGFAGVGANERIMEAFEKMREAFRQGDDTIDIIGFSRGAASALVFAWYINSQRAVQRLGTQPKIRFLGLWDTVFYIMNTVGMPASESRKVQWAHNKIMGSLLYRNDEDADITLPPNVEHVYHALSLHDRRLGFLPARIRHAHEVWFAGVHSDVGGGSEHTRLSETTLNWMVDNAVRSGVKFKNATVDSKTSDSLDYSQILKWSHWVRPIRQGDKVHTSVWKFAGDSTQGLENFDLGTVD